MPALKSDGLRTLLAATALLTAPLAGAFNIEHSEARYVDKHFRYELIVTLDAPIERVDEVLRDYDDYPSLNRRILSSKVLDRPEPGVVTLETTVEVCFGPFCRNVTRVERVQESKNTLLAVADPERSDVKFSETRSELSPGQHGATRVKYETNVVPDFWVPPVGGRRILLRKLETETRDLFMNVEQKARQPEPTSPPGP
ncbi:SRPBCC family protein [Peristeroidobacter soli]|uniref:SRPBCC family protein n=1 Tax=Peristeroidobacter soli TaxID=2497877 RepID=UPI00101BE365|nr:SRPBCC family protein [Peristeroidobacter soli]